LLFVYAVLAFMGIPQHWTKQAITPHYEAGYTEGHKESKAEPTTESAGTTESTDVHYPPYYMVAPFVLLLLAIAVLPLIPTAEHWWHKNLNKFYVAATLGILTLLYYGFLSDFPLEGHWPTHFEIAADASASAKISTVLGNAILAEFIPFIVLLFSLYVIAGGIRIEGNFKASPLVNSMIFAVGAVLANFVGTTGAAMLLIRLLLDTNRNRKYKVHTILFFIFIVCNNGGCLTPLGDPPLFLGYLRGVDFFWTLYIFPYWLGVNSVLILYYFLLDTLWFTPKEAKASKETQEDQEWETGEETRFRMTGLRVNLPLLFGVICAVAFLAPTNKVPLIGVSLFPENEGHPWFFLREAIQLGLAGLSLVLSSHWIRRANAFCFVAIMEVAVLFFGIFICMQAPLQILSVKGGEMVRYAEEKTGLRETQILFWTAAALSCWLDNAPTYVVFFEIGKSLHPRTERELLAQVNEKGEPRWQRESKFLTSHEWVDGSKRLIPVFGGFLYHTHLIAIAIGTVFIGGMTYIANGPNFMVKAIAEQSRVKMPSFFGYMVYSCLILLPLYVVLPMFFL
jgi:Na+/H+ antiporter NhaD/arsenite permease-like protein